MLTRPIRLSAVLALFLLASAASAQLATPSEPAEHRTVHLEPLTSVGDVSLRGVALEGSTTVWISGSAGTVLRSTDGGATWQSVAPPDTEQLDFRDLAILESGTVLVMSVGPDSASRIYKTTDHGSSWRLVLQNDIEGAFFNGITFRNPRSGFLTSDSTDGQLLLLRTDDGGETWQRFGTGSLPPLAAGEAGFAASGTGIVGRDEHLWVGTGGGAARVFRSSDDGENWRVSATPLPAGRSSAGIFSLTFRNPEIGVIVGGDYLEPEADDGNIAWTKDGGRSWTMAERSDPISQKACVRFLDDRTVLAVGQSGLALSHDAGRTWSVLDGPPYYAFDFDESSASGFLVGSDGRVGRLVVHR